VALSHELIEAATDPYPATRPAFNGADPDHIIWNFAVTGPGEVGDMCILESYDHQVGRLVGGFWAQRTWSNNAANAGLDPCVPAIPNEVYFGATPDFAVTVPLIGEANTSAGGLRDYMTPGISVPVGESVTIPVQLFSTAPMANWLVFAFEDRFGHRGPSTLKFGWSRQSGHNGDVLELTLTRTADGPLAGSAFVIVSEAANAGASATTLNSSVWFAGN
jgi:hypothetical protein